MSTPFTVDGGLSFPPASGAAPVPIPFALASAFDVKFDEDIPLTGSGTHTVNLSTLLTAGAKGVLILVGTGTGFAAINVRINGGGSSGQTEVSPGGFLLLGSPTPVAGPNQIDLVYTTNGRVRVIVLG